MFYLLPISYKIVYNMFNMKRTVRNFPLIAFSFFILLISCKMEDAKVKNKPIPDMIALEVRQISVSAEDRVEVFATRLEMFEDEDYSVFYDARLRNFDSDGAQRLEGKADYIRVDGNGDGTAKGNVFVKDIEKGDFIEAESLEFKDEERLLTGNGKINISINDGLSLVSNNIDADLGRRTYVFKDGITGTLELDDDEEGEEEETEAGEEGEGEKIDTDEEGEKDGANTENTPKESDGEDVTQEAAELAPEVSEEVQESE